MPKDPQKRDPIPWTRQASLLSLIGGFNESLEILMDLEKRYPDDPYIQFYLGKLFFQTREYKQSEKSYVRAWKIQPRVETADRLSATCLKLGKIHSAQGWIRKAIDIEPNDPWSRNSLGWLYYQEGDNNQALENWLDSLLYYENKLNFNYSESEPRWEDRARYTARSIVRVGAIENYSKLLEMDIGPWTINKLAVAVSTVVWNDSIIIELVWKLIKNNIGKVQKIALNKIAHAARAHFVYLLFVKGSGAAREWHFKWLNEFISYGESELMCEYLGGGKDVYSRVAMWATNDLIEGRFFTFPSSEDLTKDKRWSSYLGIAGEWGKAQEYYKRLYSEFPDNVGIEESFQAAVFLSSKLLRDAFRECGLIASNQKPSTNTYRTIEKSMLIANSIRQFSREIVPISTISLPDNLVSSTIAPSELVRTDLIAAQTLLNASSKLVGTSTGDVKVEWSKEWLEDGYVMAVLRNGHKLPVDKINKTIRSFAENQLHSRFEVSQGEIKIGFPQPRFIQ